MSRVRLAFVFLSMMLVASPAAASTAAESTITVVHAVPGESGFPADVYLNGELTVSSMLFEGSSEPVTVPAGEVLLELFEAGADPSVDAPLIGQAVTLEAGSDYSAVVQLVGDSPAVALYVNDTSPVGAGNARLTIRQTSAEGPVDVTVAGSAVVVSLASPNQATFELEAGRQPLAVLSSEGSTLVEQDVDVPAGALVVLYAVGSSADDSFALLTQQVITPQVTPSGVPTGTGGAREMASTAAWLIVPIGFVGLILIGLRSRDSRG